MSSLGKVFAWPGATSSWMHGSLTRNGLFLDQRSNDLFAYLVYQEMVRELKVGNESIIHELDYDKRYYKIPFYNFSQEKLQSLESVY